MGTDLTKLAPAKPVSFNDLANRKLGVDAMNTLYQFLSIIRQRDGTPLKDSSGNVTSHLSGLFYRSTKWIEAGIKPVYIFDGKAPDLKADESAERRKRRERAYEDWMRLKAEGKVKEAYQKAMQSSRVTDEILKESKELLSAMGIPYIQAPSEGEAQAAYMNRNGVIWGVVSQDYDSLVFGCERLIKNLSITGKRKVPGKDYYITVSPELIELKDLLYELKISKEKLIWLAVLVGTDFNPGGVKGIGPKKALELVKSKDSFDDVLNEVEWTHKNNPHEIVRLFREPPVKEVNFRFGEPDRDKILEFLCEKHDFSRGRVESTLKNLIESRKATQTGLNQFFR